MELLNLYQLLSRKTRAPIITATFIARALGLRYLQIRLDTNNKCNLQCKMCYFSIDSVRKQSKSFMTDEEFADIAKKYFPLARRVYLSCKTEPFMHKDFLSFVNVTKSYGVPFVSLVTNGTLLTRQIIDGIAESQINEIIVSVDGSTKETVEKIRPGLNYDQWLSRISDLAGSLKDCKTRIRFNMVVMRNNVSEIFGVIDLALNLNVDLVQIRQVHSRDAFDYEYGEHIEIDMGSESSDLEIDLAQIRDKVKSKIRGTNLRVIYPVASQREMSLKCSYPWFNHYIDSKGEHYPCTYLPSIGKTSAHLSYRDVFSAAKRMRKDVRGNERRECKDCARLKRLYSNSEVLLP